MKKYKTATPEETAELAADYGRNAAPGDIVCLCGPLGAGKTVFAQGFARGLGYEGRVTSPTFTIMQEYEGGRLPLYHFDLYRLEGGAGELEGIGYEDYFYTSGVSLIEWPERAEEIMPPGALWVDIQIDDAHSVELREITIKTSKV